MTVPPGMAPRPRTVNGIAPRPSSLISAPSSRSAVSSSPTGRSATRLSPVNSTVALVSEATGGRKRSTVPALPTSMVTLPARRPGVTRQPAGGPSAASTRQPSARSPSAISWVSLATSGPVISVGLSASAARTSARLVIDLEPGTAISARTGPVAAGARQGPPGPLPEPGGGPAERPPGALAGPPCGPRRVSWAAGRAVGWAWWSCPGGPLPGPAEPPGGPLPGPASRRVARCLAPLTRTCAAPLSCLSRRCLVCLAAWLRLSVASVLAGRARPGPAKPGPPRFGKPRTWL